MRWRKEQSNSGVTYIANSESQKIKEIDIISKTIGGEKKLSVILTPSNLDVCKNLYSKSKAKGIFAKAHELSYFNDHYLQLEGACPERCAALFSLCLALDESIKDIENEIAQFTGPVHGNYTAPSWHTSAIKDDIRGNNYQFTSTSQTTKMREIVFYENNAINIIIGDNGAGWDYWDSLADLFNRSKLNVERSCSDRSFEHDEMKFRLPSYDTKKEAGVFLDICLTIDPSIAELIDSITNLTGITCTPSAVYNPPSWHKMGDLNHSHSLRFISNDEQSNISQISVSREGDTNFFIEIACKYPKYLDVFEKLKCEAAKVNLSLFSNSTSLYLSSSKHGFAMLLIILKKEEPCIIEMLDAIEKECNIPNIDNPEKLTWYKNVDYKKIIFDKVRRNDPSEKEDNDCNFIQRGSSRSNSPHFFRYKLDEEKTIASDAYQNLDL